MDIQLDKDMLQILSFKKLEPACVLTFLTA